VVPRSRPGTTFTGRKRNPGCRILAVNICRGLSAEKKVIPARGKALVDTQLSIAVPLGTYGRIAPRSGLGWQFIHLVDAYGSCSIQHPSL
jgi:hypothetical protein